MHWSKDGHLFMLRQEGDNHPLLPNGLYSIGFSKELGVYLETRPGGFGYPEKLYNMENSFIDRVVTTYNATTGNLGVLLTGLRGTGKTVTAELMADKLGLPTILVTQDFPGIIDFMDSIPHAVTFVCDEFEKVFPVEAEGVSVGGQMERGASKLLPLMDGVMNSTHRRVFILTTNKLHVEPNLLQRPGRVRYLKEFSNLPKATIEMIVDDLLVRKELRTEVIDFIAHLQIITIDIVITVIEEINIHGGSPEALEGVLNVQKIEVTYDVAIIDKETMDEGHRKFGVRILPEKIDNDSLGDDIYIGHSHWGSIKNVNGEYITIDRREVLDVDEHDPKAEMVIRVMPVRTYNHESFGKKWNGADNAYRS